MGEARLTALGPAASVETILAAVDAQNRAFWADRERQYVKVRCAVKYSMAHVVCDWNTRAALAHRDAVAGLRQARRGR